MLSCAEEEEYDLVQNLGNSKLLRAMRLHSRSDDDRARQMFLTALCESDLIVFSNAPILPTSTGEGTYGHSTYGIGSKFSLAMLTDERGSSVLPLFSSTEAYLQQSFIQLEYCMAMRFPQLLDIAVAAGAVGLVIDFGLPHSVELPEESMHPLLVAFREEGLVESSSCVTADGRAESLM